MFIKDYKGEREIDREREREIGIKCAPLNAKSLTSSGDEGAPLVAVGILLNLNANQDEKRGRGRRRQRERRAGGSDRRKTPSKLGCRLRDISLRPGKHWRARYRFHRLSISSPFIFSATIGHAISNYGVSLYSLKVSRSTISPKEIYNLFEFICQTRDNSSNSFPSQVQQKAVRRSLTCKKKKKEEKEKKEKGKRDH